MKIRLVKTASKATGVQVVRYHNNKRVVLRHIGSAHSEAELTDLRISAEEWIKNFSQQLSIFPHENPNRFLHVNQSTFIGVKYHFFYNQIRLIKDAMGWAV
jgi:hypothetical protein